MPDLEHQTVLCIMGPTAAGKTECALGLAGMIDAEIISVDSAIIYRGMDVGTATPSAHELHTVVHHLVNIIDPAERYSAGQFVTDALRLIKEITARKRRVILVGGTMMYFNALQNGIADLPEANFDIRNAIELEAKEKGWDVMHAKLARIDPQIVGQIEPTDSQRISRALEVYTQTGIPLSRLQKDTKMAAEHIKFSNLVLAPDDRSVLHRRIEARFDLMLNAGFLDEVRALYGRADLQADMPSMRCVGYRQAWQHLAGEYTLDEMREKSIIATRQLAKRQLTWLRQRFAGALWINTEKPLDLLQLYRLIEHDE
jgi:tRNA dimethylallyltransferase